MDCGVLDGVTCSFPYLDDGVGAISERERERPDSRSRISSWFRRDSEIFDKKGEPETPRRRKAIELAGERRGEREREWGAANVAVVRF